MTGGWALTAALLFGLAAGVLALIRGIRRKSWRGPLARVGTGIRVERFNIAGHDVVAPEPWNERDYAERFHTAFGRTKDKDA